MSATKWPQRVSINVGNFKSILEVVRNELLRWTTELDKKGIKGQDMNFDEKEKQAAGNTVFNIGTVHGMAGNISHSQVNDYRTILIGASVPKDDRRELE